jgi:cardiolipin synthase
MVPEITPGPEAAAARAVRPRRALRSLALRALELNLNLANLITLGRLLSVPVAIWLILDERYAASFWVFVAAGVSDAVDGYVAKRFDRRTPLGALLDPLADKALLTGVYLTLGVAGHLPVWLVSLVIIRDSLILTGFAALRVSASPQRLTPLYISKLNTLVQIALVGFVLGRLGLGIDAGLWTGLLIIAAAVTTILSGMSYLARLARILARSGPST